MRWVFERAGEHWDCVGMDWKAGEPRQLPVRVFGLGAG
jgi:hypothetical protein